MSSTDDLENEAIDVRMDLVAYRTHYSKLCGKWHLQYLKNDIKTSNAFKVNLENDFGPTASRYVDDNEIKRLNLKEKIPNPYEGLDTFGEKLKNVSEVLSMIIKNKTK